MLFLPRKMHRLAICWSYFVVLLWAVPEQILGCAPNQSVTSSNAAAAAAATTAAAAAAATTTTATTTSCTACQESSLTTLTLAQAVASGFNGVAGPQAVSVARPTVTQSTDVNGCTTITTNCPVGTAAEIAVHLFSVPTATDLGNAQVYTLVCTTNNAQWRLLNGSPNPFTPGLCTTTAAGLADCAVDGYSCVTTTTTG